MGGHAVGGRAAGGRAVGCRAAGGRAAGGRAAGGRAPPSLAARARRRYGAKSTLGAAKSKHGARGRSGSSRRSAETYPFVHWSNRLTTDQIAFVEARARRGAARGRDDAGLAGNCLKSAAGRWALEGRLAAAAARSLPPQPRKPTMHAVEITVCEGLIASVRIVSLYRSPLSCSSFSNSHPRTPSPLPSPPYFPNPPFLFSSPPAPLLVSHFEAGHFKTRR